VILDRQIILCPAAAVHLFIDPINRYKTAAAARHDTEFSAERYFIAHLDHSTRVVMDLEIRFLITFAEIFYAAGSASLRDRRKYFRSAVRFFRQSKIAIHPAAGIRTIKAAAVGQIAGYSCIFSIVSVVAGGWKSHRFALLGGAGCKQKQTGD